MPLTPEQIRSNVSGELARVSGKREPFRDEDRLFEELGLNTDQKKLLAPQFQKIARSSNADANISQKECADLVTVGGAVALVVKKSEAPKAKPLA